MKCCQSLITDIGMTAQLTHDPVLLLGLLLTLLGYVRRLSGGLLLALGRRRRLGQFLQLRRRLRPRLVRVEPKLLRQLLPLKGLDAIKLLLLPLANDRLLSLKGSLFALALAFLTRALLGELFGLLTLLVGPLGFTLTLSAALRRPRSHKVRLLDLYGRKTGGPLAAVDALLMFELAFDLL